MLHQDGAISQVAQFEDGTFLKANGFAEWEKTADINEATKFTDPLLVSGDLHRAMFWMRLQEAGIKYTMRNVRCKVEYSLVEGDEP